MVGAVSSDFYDDKPVDDSEIFILRDALFNYIGFSNERNLDNEIEFYRKIDNKNNIAAKIYFAATKNDEILMDGYFNVRKVSRNVLDKILKK